MECFGSVFSLVFLKNPKPISDCTNFSCKFLMCLPRWCLCPKTFLHSSHLNSFLDSLWFQILVEIFLLLKFFSTCFTFESWLFHYCMTLHMPIKVTFFLSYVEQGHCSQVQVVLKFLYLFMCMLLELCGTTFSQLGQFHVKWLFLWFSSALQPTTIAKLSQAPAPAQLAGFS